MVEGEITVLINKRWAILNEGQLTADDTDTIENHLSYVGLVEHMLY